MKKEKVLHLPWENSFCVLSSTAYDGMLVYVCAAATAEPHSLLDQSGVTLRQYTVVLEIALSGLEES